MYKLIFFVPEAHLEPVKQAVFDAGAGRQGNYEHCAFQVKGQGQFRPMANANPFLGEVGVLETLAEWRVEVLVPREQARAVKAALLEAHPFEEVAYEFVELADI